MVHTHLKSVNTKITIAFFILLLGVAHAAPDLNGLIDALCTVESNNNPSAIGDGGQAVGILQIHPIMIKDVNRILGKDAYTLRDRLDPAKSRKICRVYLSHYGKNKTLLQMSAMWCAGPDGYRQMNKPAVKRYVDKVRRVMK